MSLTHVKVDDVWFWKCPFDGLLLAPHQAGKGKGHEVLQSKGVASRHLAKHDPHLVYHGRIVGDIINLRRNIFLTYEQVSELLKTEVLKIHRSEMFGGDYVVRIKGYPDRICRANVGMNFRLTETEGTYSPPNWVHIVKKLPPLSWWNVTEKLPAGGAKRV